MAAPSAASVSGAGAHSTALQDGRTRMELRFVFASTEQMERLERMGAFDVFPQSVGQMDAVLASA